MLPITDGNLLHSVPPVCPHEQITNVVLDDRRDDAGQFDKHYCVAAVTD